MKKILFLIVFGTIMINLVQPSCEFTHQLQQNNNDLHLSHYKSLNYLTEQQSIVSRIISQHNTDVIAEAGNVMIFFKLMEDQGFKRLNRNNDLKKQCWLHNFYQLSSLVSNNLSNLVNCSINNLSSMKLLSKQYFYSMINEMLYQSTLGTTNTLYAIGQYNILSEQWKISKTLEGTVKYTQDNWNGTKEIVEGEVQQIKQGVGSLFQILEECNSLAAQNFLNNKTEITKYMNNC